MPTGQKTIIWTAANDERLLLSILAVHNIRVDAPNVAKVFGNNIATSVIQTRMAKLKAKARALNPGVVPTDAVVLSGGTKRSHEITKAKSITAKKKVKTEASDDDGNDIDHLNGTQINATNDRAVTPPATPRKKTSTSPTKPFKLTSPSPKTAKEETDGQLQGKRCSPRDRAKPNYQQLDDPFVYMEGATGENEINVFGQVTDSESEDLADSDQDFDGEELATEA